MRKIAAVANSNAKKLASQGQLGTITPEMVDTMEMRKASYLVDYAVQSVKDSGAEIHPDVLTSIVKTANACIPAMSLLLPMDKFAALCDTVLEGAAFEVGQHMSKQAALQKRAEGMFEANPEMGSVNNPEGEMDYVMELLKEIGLDAGTAGLFTGAEYDKQPEETVVNNFNQHMEGNNPVKLEDAYVFNDSRYGYAGPDVAFSPALTENGEGADFSEFDASAPQSIYKPAALGHVAELKYIDAMNAITKTAELIQKMVKKAGEAGNSPEVAAQVKDEGTPSAAKPAEEKAAAAEKKPEINATNVDKPNLTQKAVESDAKNTLTPDADKAPTMSQGNVNMNDGSTKMSSLKLDKLVTECKALFSK